MSSEETTATAEPPATAALEAGDVAEHSGAHEEHGHPGPGKYVLIAIVLAVVTGIEVGLYYIDMPNGLMIALLMFLAVIKFGMVAAYFMHLRFDSTLLTRLFVTGMILAIAIYAVALFTLDILFN